MDHFAGLDVSVKETISICIVDDAGKIVREVKVASEPEALLAVLKNLAYHFKRIRLEAGPLSQWLFSVRPEYRRVRSRRTRAAAPFRSAPANLNRAFGPLASRPTSSAQSFQTSQLALNSAFASSKVAVRPWAEWVRPSNGQSGTSAPLGGAEPSTPYSSAADLHVAATDRVVLALVVSGLSPVGRSFSANGLTRYSGCARSQGRCLFLGGHREAHSLLYRLHGSSATSPPICLDFSPSTSRGPRVSLIVFLPLYFLSVGILGARCVCYQAQINPAECVILNLNGRSPCRGRAVG